MQTIQIANPPQEDYAGIFFDHVSPQSYSKEDFITKTIYVKNAIRNSIPNKLLDTLSWKLL